LSVLGSQQPFFLLVASMLRFKRRGLVANCRYRSTLDAIDFLERHALSACLPGSRLPRWLGTTLLETGLWSDIRGGLSKS